MNSIKMQGKLDKIIGNQNANSISMIFNNEKAEISLSIQELASQLDFNEKCHLHLELTKRINKTQEVAPEQIAKCYSCACAVLSSYDFGKHCLTCDPCGDAKGYVEINKPQESICASCLKNCKATHPRYACTLFKPIRPTEQKPERKENNRNNGCCYTCGQKWNNHDPLKCKLIYPTEQKERCKLDKDGNPLWGSKLAGQKSEQITLSLCDTCRKGCKVRREGTVNNCSKYKPVCEC